MKKRTRKSGHQSEDQYGEMGASQDRDEAFGSYSRGSLQGGGSAGGGQSRRGDVVYQRQVPKFLKEHMHHLEPRQQRRTEEIDDDEEDRRIDEQEAWNRALEEDPSLAKELNEDVVNKANAARLKEEGNEAYARGDFPTAVRKYTACIELDPTNEVFYSNRASVYTIMKDFDKAAADANTVIRMKPRWVKGWARLAVAEFGLEKYSHAKEAYIEALKLEPDHNLLIDGRNKAEEMEQKQIKENKHTFSRKKPRTTPSKSRGSKKKSVDLSYDDEGDH